MTHSRPTKVGLLTNIYTPYKEAMLREIAKLVDLKVYYCKEREADRDWEVKFSGAYDYEILPSKTWIVRGVELYYNPGFAARIAADQVDFMIVGEWGNITVMVVPFWLRFQGIPRILWSGSTSLEQGKLRIITEPLKRLIISQYEGYVTYTQRAAEYVQLLGAPAEQTTVAPVTVDTDFFYAESVRLRKDDGRAALREKYEIEEETLAILFVGQMIKRKGVDLLIDAVAKLDLDRPLKVHLAGSGPDLTRFKAHAAAAGLEDHFVFHGHCTQNQLVELYVACDLFTLPSRQEPSGNVINEAMTTGLPVVISSQIGCDCVTDSKTGFIFESGNVEHYTQTLRAILSDDKKRAEMGQAAQVDLLTKFSIQIEANQFAKAIQRVLHGKGRPFVPLVPIDSQLRGPFHESEPT
ncbi:MAG: glycosyltransferase family 4 protein [Myxococcota bacterium]|nr:glycosyltransferase family 4 protein [Myxococcota bacterium]